MSRNYKYTQNYFPNSQNSSQQRYATQSSSAGFSGSSQVSSDSQSHFNPYAAQIQNPSQIYHSRPSSSGFSNSQMSYCNNSQQMPYPAAPSSSQQFFPVRPSSSQNLRRFPIHEKRAWDRNQGGKPKKMKMENSPCTEFMSQSAKKEKKNYNYDSDETIISGDEIAKLEITPKKEKLQVKKVESGSQVTPKNSRIEKPTLETPKQKIMMESSSQVTPSLSQLQTEPAETPEQLRIKTINSSSQVTPIRSQLETGTQELEAEEDKQFKKPLSQSQDQSQTPLQTPKPVKSRIKTPHHAKLQLTQNDDSAPESESSESNSVEAVEPAGYWWKWIHSRHPERRRKKKLIFTERPKYCYGLEFVAYGAEDET